MDKFIENMTTGKRIGAIMTIGIHLFFFLFLSVKGLKTIYPPPEERGVLIEFPLEEAVAAPIIEKGREPQAQVTDPQKDVELVQQSKSQTISEKPSQSKTTTANSKGDVEKQEPKREEPIDSRSLFSSNDNNSNKEAEQTAAKVSDALKSGVPNGNTDSGKSTGEAIARLQGRNTLGSLPKPIYPNINEGGVVVVRIFVDQDGNVVSAEPGKNIPNGEKTTTTNQRLWAEAKKAALKAKFTKSGSIEQMGYIVYIFTLTT